MRCTLQLLDQQKAVTIIYCKYPVMALVAEVSTLHTASHMGFSVKFENVTPCRFVFTQLLTPITSVNHKIRGIQLIIKSEESSFTLTLIMETTWLFSMKHN